MTSLLCCEIISAPLLLIFYNIAPVHWGLQILVSAHLFQGLATTFECGWSPDFHWILESCCRFAMFGILVASWPGLVQASAVRWPHFCLQSTLVCREVHGWFGDCTELWSCGWVSWSEVFVPKCVWFTPNMVLCVIEHLYLGLNHPENIAPEVFWFVQMQL